MTYTTDDFEPLWIQYEPLIKSQIDKTRKRFGNHYQLEWDDAEQESRMVLLRCIERSATIKVAFGAYFRSALSRSLLDWVRRTLPHRWIDHRSTGGKQWWEIIETVSFDQLPPDTQDPTPKPPYGAE